MKLKFLVKALVKTIFGPKKGKEVIGAVKSIEEQMKSITDYNADYKWAVNQNGVMNAFTSRDAARKFARQEGINQKEHLYYYNGTFWLKYSDYQNRIHQMKEER